MSVFRLAPKVRVAVTTMIASTAPNITERTGTALRPRPLSRANRSPAIPETGMPAARPSLHDARAVFPHRSREVARCGAWR